MPQFLASLSSSLAFLLSIVGLVTVVLTYLRRGRIRFGQFQLEFPREIRAGGDITINQSLPAGAIPTDPGKRQYSLMQQYHSQGLAQSKISFWFSLVFSSPGFIVIIISLLTMDKDSALTSQGKTLAGLISGTVIDAVSALFFVQSNKARHLMTEFFDKLRVDRKFEESLQICETVPSPTARSNLKVIMALNFADVSVSESVLVEILRDTTEKPLFDTSCEGDAEKPGNVLNEVNEGIDKASELNRKQPSTSDHRVETENEFAFRSSTVVGYTVVAFDSSSGAYSAYRGIDAKPPSAPT
jgi:hypothetical protein